VLRAHLRDASEATDAVAAVVAIRADMHGRRQRGARRFDRPQAGAISDWFQILGASRDIVASPVSGGAALTVTFDARVTARPAALFAERDGEGVAGVDFSQIEARRKESDD
jgi:hypothetical protein